MRAVITPGLLPPGPWTYSPLRFLFFPQGSNTVLFSTYGFLLNKNITAMAASTSSEILAPKKLPDETHHVIVILEAVHIPVPEFDTSPMTHEVLRYQFTSAKDDVAGRIGCASIVVVGVCPITEETLSKAPYL